MSNLDKPASAVGDLVRRDEDGHLYGAPVSTIGFTKRERACIDLRIPESGDAELDVLIKKARYFETAAKAMQGLIEQGHPSDSPEVAFAHASAIIGMMERIHD